MLTRAARLLILFALAGCDRDAAHPHSHGKPKEEEEKAAQVTVWGDRFEIFLEHKFIVADTPTGFVTHVTDLKTLEARRAGKVVFVLRQGDGPATEHVEDAPERAGIYVPKLKFPRAGEWKVGLRIPVDGQESLVDLPPFKVFATKDEALKAPEIEAPEGISFLKEQQWKVLTRTEPVVKRKLVAHLRLPGTVAVRPGSRAAVTPPMAGRLLAPPGKPLPTLGERVEAGQTLALIQPPFSDFAAKLVEADAEVIRTKLGAEQAEVVLARMKKLAAAQAKTEREQQETEFNLRAAQARHQAALALQAVYRKAGAFLQSTEAGGLPVLELKAPIAGTVVQVSAAIGEHVPSDRAVFSILDTGTVLIEARIPEADLPRLGTSLGASYEAPEDRTRLIPILGEGGGRWLFFGSEVDPASRTVPLLYEVKNPDGRLRIGLALTLHVETARIDETLTVPASAVIDEDAKPIAFVQVSGETFQKRSLKLGVSDGAYLQVLEGVAEGERVVTKEAYAIRLASVSSVIPAHGHAH